MPKNAKIHIAGPLVGDVQKCLRCKARIDGNRRWPQSPSGWPEGERIYAASDGMSVVSAFGDKYAGVRPCGSQQ